MKQIAFVILSLGAVVGVGAQEAPADSLETRELEEFVIEAPRVIRKADMDVYHPSKSAVEHASNGIQLLRNLMIPSLNISDAFGTIMAAGEGVQVRINGRESSLDQVRALLPETIKRVEWIDNPGLRYGGANYVLNVIVANPTLGGSLMASAMPALNQGWGFYMADAKFNTGRSQWSVGGNFKLANKLKVHRDYTETFTRPDGSELTRNEKSLGGCMDNTMSRLWASYNYIKSDTTILMVDFGLRQNLRDRFAYNGLLSFSDSGEDLELHDIHGQEGKTPSLSLYWQQNFRNKQTFVVNFNSSFYFGHTYSDYLELPVADGSVPDPVNDIHTNIKDRNQAYVLEADYIRNWNNSRFTAGASYTANRNRSEYEYLDGQIFHQRQDKVYLFAEYFRSFGKWTATAGMGVQYTEFLFKESGRGNHSWSPRPQATLTYSINQRHNFRLSFTSWQSTPTLAETNTVPQQLDGFQWRVGNQDLKTASSYMLTLMYRFGFPRVNGVFGIRAFTSPDAITPLLRWDDDRLITTYENSRGLQNLSFFIAPQVDIIRDWLSASGYLQFRAERMRGKGYDLHNSAWSGSVNLQLTHWGFVLSAMYIRAQRDLWGEKISWGEDLNKIDFSYNWKAWQFSAGVIMPFGKYDQGSRTLSKWNTNEQHMRLNMRIPYIEISYNLQWGRQKRGARKLVNTDANADISTAGGR